MSQTQSMLYQILHNDTTLASQLQRYKQYLFEQISQTMPTSIDLLNQLATLHNDITNSVLEHQLDIKELNYDNLIKQLKRVRKVTGELRTVCKQKQCSQRIEDDGIDEIDGQINEIFPAYMMLRKAWTSQRHVCGTQSSTVDQLQRLNKIVGMIKHDVKVITRQQMTEQTLHNSTNVCHCHISQKLQQQLQGIRMSKQDLYGIMQKNEQIIRTLTEKNLQLEEQLIELKKYKKQLVNRSIKSHVDNIVTLMSQDTLKELNTALSNRTDQHDLEDGVTHAQEKRLVRYRSSRGSLGIKESFCWKQSQCLTTEQSLPVNSTSNITKLLYEGLDSHYHIYQHQAKQLKQSKSKSSLHSNVEEVILTNQNQRLLRKLDSLNNSLAAKTKQTEQSKVQPLVIDNLHLEQRNSRRMITRKPHHCDTSRPHRPHLLI